MHPNSGYRPPYSPNNINVNFQHSQNNYSPYQQYEHQGSNLMPPTQHSSNRGVYTSMIQPQGPPGAKPSSGLLGRLETMGRVVKEEPDPVVKINEPQSYTHNTLQVPQQPQNTNMLNFRAGGDKPKMASSVIFPKSDDGGSFNNFQSSAVQQGTGTSRLQALMKNKNQVQVHVQEQQTETPEQKRKREIESIKSQLGKLNKKMENFSFKKPGETGTGDTKQYFQLPSRKPNQQSGNTSDNANFNFSKTYSGSESSSSGSNATNYSSGGGMNYKNNTNETTKQESNYLQAPSFPIQHSLSDNNLRKRQEPSPMFKKKNPYQMQPPAQNTMGARKFMLSPKASNQPKLDFPKKTETSATNEFKAAEVVTAAQVIDVPRPKKGMKRVDSSQKPLNEVVSEPNEPKKFKRSDFIVGKKLGKGQFGEVMLVIHKETGFLCGMKVMSKKQIVEEKYVNQVARELSIQFYLSHRNVSPLYGYFQDQENVYLLLEFATGGQLLQLLRKAHRMEEAQCSPIIRQICQGLDYIHKEQIIHRDIKPENILFNFDTVKICDFGWAVYNGDGMRRTVAGSPLYYSPQIVKEDQYDEKIDIWAIGMMAYQCLLGKIPFRIYSELDLNRIVSDQIKFPQYIDVSDQAKDFILKICKKQASERMEIRQMMRHPFITKYANQRKVGGEVLQEFKKVLMN